MSDGRPALPEGVRLLQEPPGRIGAIEPAGTGAYEVALYSVPDWTETFPWLVQGTTAAGADFGLFGSPPVGAVMDRWRQLRDAAGTPLAVHAKQVHGATVVEHTEPDPRRAPGLRILDDADGHVTGVPGILLTVSLADCVPISLVDPGRRRVALLHGGWRGTAAGIIAVGLRALGAEPTTVAAHLGPAICGQCYEVGPEVFEALELTVPDRPTPVDLRAVQARRLVDAGVPAEQISVSAWCTRCGGHGQGEGHGPDDAPFFSHRGGDAGRQLGILGIR